MAAAAGLQRSADARVPRARLRRRKLREISASALLNRLDDEMDRITLLAHEVHWDREPVAVNTHLPGLNTAEAALYRDLVEDTFGPNVRLEQERVPYPVVEATVAALR